MCLLTNVISDKMAFVLHFFPRIDAHEPQLGAVSVQTAVRNLLLSCYERLEPPPTSHNSRLLYVCSCNYNARPNNPNQLLVKFQTDTSKRRYIHHSKLFTTIIILTMVMFNLLFIKKNIYENILQVSCFDFCTSFKKIVLRVILPIIWKV